MLASFVPAATLAADDPPAGERWRTSPYHRVINPATGKPIPCVCRFQGRDYPVGAAVCMQTHVGVVIAKCDLFLNNTTWAPTADPCTVSWRPPRGGSQSSPTSGAAEAAAAPPVPG